MTTSTSSINLNNITTDANGKVRVSGLASNIDWKNIVDAQVQARRAPAVQLETKVTRNTSIANAYSELKGKVSAVSTALDKLRAAPGSSNDVFNQKIATGTVAAASGAPSGFVPSDINSLLLTSISNTAQTGNHKIKIDQLAAAQQIRADSFNSTTATLASMGVTTGSFTLGGKTITVSGADTLQDLRANINAAGAGVTATVISSSPTSHFLVMTAANSGVANQIAFGGGGNAVTNSLGLTNGGAVKTQLTAAADAQLTVDGISGITRSSNTITDVINGVTLNLLKAEANTEINLKVAPDLNSIKTAIADFTMAYNDVRSYFTDQRTAKDRNGDGRVADNELGVLAYDQRLRDVVNKLGELASSNFAGNADGFKSLSQLGVTIDADYKLKVDDATLDARLLSNVSEVRKLFGFTTTTSDSRATVLGRTAATQDGTYYLNVAGTNGVGAVTSANLKTVAGTGIGGADDGSLSISGQALTGLTGNSTGLGLFFSGGNNLGAVNGITVTVQRGVADKFYDYFNELVKPAVGGLDTDTNALLTQNTLYNDQVKVIDERLVVLRSSLEGRFTRMETALSELNNLRSTIESFFKTSSSS